MKAQAKTKKAKKKPVPPFMAKGEKPDDKHVAEIKSKKKARKRNAGRS